MRPGIYHWVLTKSYFTIRVDMDFTFKLRSNNTTADTLTGLTMRVPIFDRTKDTLLLKITKKNQIAIIDKQ